MTTEEDEMVEVLKEVDLLAFLPRIRNNLNATRISHFDYVKREDLEGIGMSRPAARRLLHHISIKRHPPSASSSLSTIFNNLLGVRHHYRGQPRLDGRPKFYHHENHETIQDDRLDHVNGQIERGYLISRCDICLQEKLGQGTFGEVWKAEWKRQNGTTTLVAVKMLRDNALDLPGAFSDFVKEVEAMMGLCHPNLIQLYGVNLSSPYMIIQELAPLGSVLDRLRKEASLTSVLVIFDWSRQIVQGMTYLENKKLVHRDLAARNLFLTVDKVKIGDFGLMKSIDQNAECYTMTERKQIPFPWCAPECLKLLQFSSYSDVWAFAVTLWELFTFGEHPWAGLNGAQILQAIDQEGKRLVKPKACPSELYNVMQNCWAHRRQDRPTFSMLSQFYSTVYLDEMKVLVAVKEEGTLSVEAEDRVTVIDGRAENHWWICQNQRTYKIGRIARRLLFPIYRKKASPSDISHPLRNSLVHAGHGDPDPNKSFGNPSAIDDLFLRNPVPPTDLLLNLETDSANINTNITSLPAKSRSSVLVEFSDNFSLPPDQLPRRNSWADLSQSSQYSNAHVNLIDPNQPKYFNVPPQTSVPSADLLGSPTLVVPSASIPMYYRFPSSNQDQTNVGGQSSYCSNIPTQTTQQQLRFTFGDGVDNLRSAFTKSSEISNQIDTTSTVRFPASYFGNSVLPKMQPEVLPKTTSNSDLQQIRLPKPPRSSNVGRKERIIKTVPIPTLYVYSDVFDSSKVFSTPKEIAVVSPFNVQPKKQTTPQPEPGGTSSVLDDLTRSVSALLPGESLASCQNALRKSHFDVEKSVKFLKIQRLTRLNIASEEDCVKMLEIQHWDVLNAADALLCISAPTLLD